MIRRNCGECGKFFFVKYPSNSKKFCSRQCAGASKRTGDYKICEVCSDKFYLPKWREGEDKGKYCSWSCRDESRLTGKEIECENCGNSFYVQKSSIENGNRKYCSQKCYAESMVSRIVVKCNTCGDEFEEVKSRVKMNDHHFCSRKCWNEFVKNRNFARERGNIHKCDNCGDETYRKPSHRGNNVFCSYECMGDYNKKYPNTLELRRKIQERNRRKNLDDSYVKRLINSLIEWHHGSRINRDDIPKELIELKRLNIKRKRLIKNHKQKS